MKKHKLPKGIKIKPLLKLGLTEKEVSQLIVNMMPVIDQELKDKVHSQFSKDELVEIGKAGQSKGLRPDQGFELIEEAYYKKTGRYFLEELRLLINDYINKVTKLIKKLGKMLKN